MIAIIDYDAGNIKSVEKAMQLLGQEVTITRDRETIMNADKVILPGVGAFGDAMGKLRQYGLDEVIRDVTAKGTPFLGICLGLQLLFERSDETPGVEGLGILKGEILRIPDQEGLKIPHMGWNSLKFQNNGRLFKDIPEDFVLNQYASLVHDSYSVRQYARFLDVLLHQEEGAVLWHCSIGKDRAGVGTVLLLCALGVPRETIYEDYMKTNLYLDEEMNHMVRYLESKMIVDNQTMDKIRLLYRVKEEYLDCVFETIEKDYGSVEQFMKKALYMNPKTIEALRKKYLV